MLADIGSEGYVVVGRSDYDAYCKWLVHSKGYSKNDIVEVEASPIVYRFGAGSSESLSTY